MKTFCLESCWWHLVEKRYCFDHEIALYSEPELIEDKSNNNMFDNMAFYDQVKIIAGRSIVTIEPLPTKPRPIEHQPKPKLRWFEDAVEKENKENISRNAQSQPPPLTPPKIITTNIDNESKEIDVTDSKVVLRKPKLPEKAYTATTRNLSHEALHHESPCHPAKDIVKSATSPDILSPSLLDSLSPETEKTRKKSLRERRMSRSLTLTIDKNNVELPVFRHTSMPKFYLDTPEVNQIDSTFLMTPSVALTSPILPRNSESGLFDLRSIVQIENEHRAHQPLIPIHRQSSQHSRLSQIKERLKSTKPTIKLKKSGSATNLPNSIQHI